MRVSSMLNRGKKRAAFTMIEMVMVIVILGVVAMIGTDIIAKMYQGYLRAQIVNELQQKTELALDQITKRLKYRIKASVIAKNVDDPTIFKPLSEDNASSLYNMIEWIGYDNEGFLGEWNTTNNRYEPNWSGFIDIKATGANSATKTQVSTSGSTLSNETSIGGLSYDQVSLINMAKDAPAIIFKKHTQATPRTFGFDPDSTEHNDTFAVRRTGDNILTFQDGGADKTIIEQYYLAWTAYAIGPRKEDSNVTTDNFDLMLYYNYQPWLIGSNSKLEAFDDNTTQQQLIVDNVSTFRFTQTGNTVQIKLCVQDGNKTGTPIGFCKEKAVF